MSCYRPLKAFQIGVNPESGKAVLKVVPYGVHHLEFRHGVWYACNTEYLSPYREKSALEFVEIPCGSCVGCRLEYSRQWANRCMLELQYHESAYFVTITYDDDHIPIDYYSDPESGEAYPCMTLRKRDFQLFMKRLRKRFSDCQIRFFASGEYGSESMRPHYHAIIFGLKLDDLVPWRVDRERNFVYYNSASLQSCWCEPKVRGDNTPLVPFGYIVVAQVTWETCAYTARYVMKKLKGPDAQFYVDHNMESPFTLMSRKPGIAYQYYVDHPECMEHRYINVSTEKGGRKFPAPKYFERLFEVDCPEKSILVKEMRKRLAQEATRFKLANTSLDYFGMLEVEESNLVARISSLKRSMI